MKRVELILVLICSLITTQAQKQVKSADDVLAGAFKKAEAANKNVLVIFHASWCGWCHKMDSSLRDKKCKRLFEENYVIVHLAVEESDNKKSLENPGAFELKKKYSGENAGLPFWVILNVKGKLQADSYIRKMGISLNEAGDNIGCPAKEPEVAYFVSVLKKTSRLSDADLEIIAKRFRENDAK